MNFYHFRQNNSGGHFHRNENVDVHVIVEAHTADEANTIAESKGIYFNGCDDGRDCECCGDRWSRQYSDDNGEAFPNRYGQPIGQDMEDTVIHYYEAKS